MNVVENGVHVLLLIYKARHELAPEYLSDLIPQYVPCRRLRSEDLGKIVTPRFRLDAFGGRTFTCIASRSGNSLDNSIRKSETLSSFKFALNTRLFRDFLERL